jgi:membrane carboxypeptidase/penicillin-binding protein PbpC
MSCRCAYGPSTGLCYAGRINRKSSYEDVLQHYINAGPFALPALQGAEAVLKEMGQEQRVLKLYAEAAKLVVKPDMLSGRTEFIQQSNWYQVHEGYAGKLEAAGQKQLADQIRSQDKG